MSEYQYYEWLALDQPLTIEELAEVEDLSSHITVSARGAWVDYSWGDFKHDPLDVMARYFDAFLYLANWGDRRLAFRFPKDLIDPDCFEPYLEEWAIELTRVGDYFILDMSLSETEIYEWIEGSGLLAHLALLRGDILDRDMRALYLAWLAVWQHRGMDGMCLSRPCRRDSSSSPPRSQRWPSSSTWINIS